MSEPSPEIPSSPEMLQPVVGLSLPTLSQELKETAFSDSKYAAGARILKGTSTRWTTMEGVQFEVKADTIRSYGENGRVGHMSILSLAVEYEFGVAVPPSELIEMVADYEDEMPVQQTIASIAVQHEVVYTVSSQETLGWQANRTYTITHEVTEEDMEAGDEVEDSDSPEDDEQEGVEYIMTIMREAVYTRTLANVFPLAKPRELNAGDKLLNVDEMFLAMEEEVRIAEAQKVYEMMVLEDEDGFDLLTVLPHEAVKEIEMIRKKLSDEDE